MKFRTITAATAALALGLGGALAIATPASAASADVTTPGWVWEGVGDDGLYIEDAFSHYLDFQGTGLETLGWTSDAFDGYIGTVTLNFDGGETPVTLTPVSADYVDGGLSTIVGSGTGVVNSTNVTVTSKLEIQGSFARWTFSFEGDAGVLADTTFTVDGDLGSDGESTYTLVGSHGLVSHDEFGSDPILGWDSSDPAVAIDAVDGDDAPSFTSPAVNGTSLTVALLDYDTCGRDAAIAQLAAAVPTLTSQFGTTLAPVFTTDCATVANPAVTPGPVSINMPITQSAALVNWRYFEDPDDVWGVVAPGLPAGLTLSVTNVGSVPVLHLTGTAPAGSYSVTAWVYFVFAGEGGTINQSPLAITFTFGTALAATGSEVPTSAIIGASILSLLGVALVTTAGLRRRRSA